MIAAKLAVSALVGIGHRMITWIRPPRWSDSSTILPEQHFTSRSSQGADRCLVVFGMSRWRSRRDAHNKHAKEDE